MKAWINFEYIKDNLTHGIYDCSIWLCPKEGSEEVRILINDEYRQRLEAVWEAAEQRRFIDVPNDNIYADRVLVGTEGGMTHATRRRETLDDFIKAKGWEK